MLKLPYYNHFHNTLRLFDFLPNIILSTSEVMWGSYLQTWCMRVASGVAERVKTYNLWKLGNFLKALKFF